MQSLIKVKNNFTGGLESEVNAVADAQKNILTSAGNPGYFETRRRGDSWNIMTSTEFAALVAVPTTTARLEVYNNGSRLLVVSDLHMWRLIGTAVAVGETLWAMVTTAKAIPSLTAQTMYSLCGKAFKVPTATSEVVTGVGTTVIANGWAPYGAPQAYLGAATPGAGQSAPIDGKLIVPPGCSLCIQVAASVNTASAFYCGVTFDLVTGSVEV